MLAVRGSRCCRRRGYREARRLAHVLVARELRCCRRSVVYSRIAAPGIHEPWRHLFTNYDTDYSRIVVSVIHELWQFVW